MIKPFHNAHLNWPIFLANTRIAVKSRRGKIVLYGVNYRFLKTFVSRRLFEFLWSRAHRKSSSSCSERTLGPKLIASQQLRLQLNVHHRRNDEPDYKPHKWTWLLRRLRHPFGPATLLSPVTKLTCWIHEEASNLCRMKRTETNAFKTDAHTSFQWIYSYFKTVPRWWTYLQIANPTGQWNHESPFVLKFTMIASKILHTVITHISWSTLGEFKWSQGATSWDD